ncbi:Toll-like receptor 2-like protein [Elysia marginata]|uniref:Toll-like receptor 2-like protein n=1 Tax=Elysia marginata TaxID=1093978 RepID=A0AAV4H2V7_9GAST|nr:Toll-like receptor 2-like protein [Elysia marginata]
MPIFTNIPTSSFPISESKFEGSQYIDESSAAPVYDFNVCNVNAPRRLSNCSFSRIPYHYQPPQQQQQQHYSETTANTAAQASRGGTMPCNPGDAEKEPLMGVGAPSSANAASHDASVREFIGATTELLGETHNDLTQAYELKHQLPSGPHHQSQFTHTPSPGTKMKMKNLKLADAAASRFRLTFDESADGPANKYIDVPIDVSPHTPSMGPKRPSCICGEPELPPGDVFSLLPDPNKDHMDNRQTQSCHSNLKNLNDVPAESTSGNQIQLLISPPSNNSSMSNIFYGSQQASETTSSTPLPPLTTSECPGSMSPATDLSLDVISSGNSSDNKNTTSETEQSSQELNGVVPHTSAVEHPKVTICISNSQQSFIPLNYDSNSPHDSGSEDHHVQQQQQQPQHQCAYQNSHNYHQFGPGNSFYYPSPGMPSAGDNYSYYPDDMVNGFIPGTETDDLVNYGGYGGPYSQRPVLQQQDTVSAPPIQDLYRYHVFFSHCSEDREWVEHMVSHLEAPPFNYTCAYASVEDEADPSTLQQRILCAAMLSERVVLVLSNRYVEETWFNFEKTLKQLTQMSLHNQRIMGVLLEDCDIPDSLGELYFLDSSDPDFFHVFTKRLKTSA